MKRIMIVLTAVMAALAPIGASAGPDDRRPHWQERHDDRHGRAHKRDGRRDHGRHHWQHHRHGRGYAHGHRHGRRHLHRHGYRHRHGYHHHHRHGRYRPAVSTVSTVYVPRPSPAPRAGHAGGHCGGELLGSVIGGATGAFVGSHVGKGTGRLVATAAGAVVGLLVGGDIGRTMDRADQDCVGEALERAPDTNPVVWQKDDGTRYEVTPTETYRDRDGRYCREYQTTVVIGGRAERAYGTACRQPDGSWQKTT